MTQDSHLNIIRCKRDDLMLAIPIVNTDRVLFIPFLVDAPTLPRHVVGQINIENDLIPIVDVLLMIRSHINRYNIKSSILINKDKNASIGLIVDDVIDLINADLSCIDSSELLQSLIIDGEIYQFVNLPMIANSFTQTSQGEGCG